MARIIHKHRKRNKDYFSKIDYNELLNKIDEERIFIDLLNYICDLKLKIEPSKEQYFNIKNAINKFKINYQTVQFRFISNYNDYIDKTYNDDEKEIFFLSFLEKEQPTRTTKHISNVLNSNLMYLKNELIFKILDLLINKIEKSPQFGKKSKSTSSIIDYYYYLFTILQFLLFLKKNSNNEINQQEIKIKKIINLNFKLIIKEPDCLNDVISSKKFNAFQVMEYFLELLEDDNRNFKNNLIYYSILEIYDKEYRIKGSGEINLLKFIRKYNNEIIEYILGKERFVTVFKNLDPLLIKQVAQILLYNCQFAIDWFLVFLSVINYLKEEKKEEEEDDQNIFENEVSITYDVFIEIYKLLYSDFKLIENKRVNDFIDQEIAKDKNAILEVYEFNPKKVLSVYKINENTFIKQLQQDELLLLEIYNNYFEIVVLNFDIECLIPYLFDSIKDSPVKLCFLKSKLNYLLEACNINIINHWILPHFSIECQQSSVYQIKISQTATLSTIGNGEKRISNIIWNEILLKYLDSSSTSMYQKLQISLVSKYFYSKTVDIINNSISVPIVISSCRFFFTNNSNNVSSESKSLLKPNQVKFIKFYYKSAKNRVYSRNKDLELSHLLNQCKSIEIFHLKSLSNGDDDDFSSKNFIEKFNYLNWYGSRLSKLVINCPLDDVCHEEPEEAFKYSVINMFKDYKKKFQGKVQAILNLDINRPMNVNERNLIDFSLVNKLSCPISQYFGNNYLEIDSLQNIEYLKFNIDHKFMKNAKLLKYFKTRTTNSNENILSTNQQQSFRNVRKLYLEIKSTSKFIFNSFDQLFGFFGNKISNKFNEIEISLLESKDVSFSNILEVIFKVISNNHSFYNVNQITISNYINPNNDHHHWNLVNSYSFIQKPFTQFKFNSIEFIRSKTDVQEIKCNKRKLDQIMSTMSGKEEVNHNDDHDDDDYQLDLDNKTNE